MYGNQNQNFFTKSFNKSVTQRFPQNYPNLKGDFTTSTFSTANSSQNINPNITFYISFSTGQTFKINANQYHSFESVFNEFLKENFIEGFKNSIKCILCEANTIEYNKSLINNKIMQNSRVLCYIDNTITIEQGKKHGHGFRFYGVFTKKGRNLQNEASKINQDTPLVYLNLGNIKGFNMFGVFDGHGLKGDKISQFCRYYFVLKMNDYAYKCQKQNISNPEDIYYKLKSTNFQFINDCFTNADIEMTKQKDLEYNWSGTTCTLVIQLNFHLICASVGDSRSIIIYDDGTKTNQGIAVFSKDHLPNLPNEMARIIKSGGMVKRLQNNLGQEVGRYRVFKSGQKHPGLPISRSLGDFIAKECGVINQPDLMELTINQNIKYLIIGSGGLWRYLKNEDIRNVGNIYYQQGDIKFFCSKLVEYAVETWEKKDYCRDDITIVGVFF